MLRIGRYHVRTTYKYAFIFPYLAPGSFIIVVIVIVVVVIVVIAVVVVVVIIIVIYCLVALCLF